MCRGLGQKVALRNSRNGREAGRRRRGQCVAAAAAAAAAVRHISAGTKRTVASLACVERMAAALRWR